MGSGSSKSAGTRADGRRNKGGHLWRTSSEKKTNAPSAQAIQDKDHGTRTPLPASGAKPNPLESPADIPIMACALTPPSASFSSPEASTGLLRRPLEGQPQSPRTLAQKRPTIEVPRFVTPESGPLHNYTAAVMPPIPSCYPTSPDSYRSSTTAFPRPSATSATASASMTGYNHRRLYVGQEMELSEGADRDTDALDDFALASTHSLKFVPRKPGQGLYTGSTPLPEIRLTEAKWGRVSLPQSPASPIFGQGTAALTPVESPTTASRSPRRDKAAEEILDFLSFRRPGFSECRKCLASLMYGSNFCSHCGTPTEAKLLGTPMEYGSSPMNGASAQNISWVGNGVSTGSHASAASSCLTASAGLKDEELCGPRPVFPYSPAIPSITHSPASLAGSLKRKVYHRRVKIISPYEKKHLLGSGACGTVFKAIDTQSGQQLAVKEMFMNPQDRDEVAAVRNELHHLSTLRHRNIIEYLGTSITEIAPTDMISLLMSDDGQVSSPSLCDATMHMGGGRGNVGPEPRLRVCILMERMEGGTLETLLEEFPDGMPESAVVDYMAQILDAVRYLHSMKLTHRDIKPSNILLTSDGLAKLSDFGCAVVTAAGAGEGWMAGSTEGAGAAATARAPLKIQGTPAYMPPEAFSMNGKTEAELSLQCMAQDIWAIGCVTHQLLTGKVPWAHLNFANPFALFLHLQDNLRPDETFPIDAEALSASAADFCRACFERNLSKRASATFLLSHPFIRGASETCLTTPKM